MPIEHRPRCRVPYSVYSRHVSGGGISPLEIENSPHPEIFEISKRQVTVGHDGV